MQWFESRGQKPIPRRHFYRRLGKSFAIGVGLLSVALLIGILGYHFLAPMPWIDALLNASMILAGMGPVDNLQNDTVKVFASMYAIFSGVMFISVMAVILSPAVHRLLHKFHAETEEDEKE
jgi:hypothetical protein